MSLIRSLRRRERTGESFCFVSVRTSQPSSPFSAAFVLSPMTRTEKHMCQARQAGRKEGRRRPVYLSNSCQKQTRSDRLFLR